ncbi:PIN-like domain-containing protein [Chryseobacterium gambrini]|uniref:PIN-like domain-containing protein n=1 Tax=Chryseobacterium gambrini TaxID=373672 RepID=UPI003BA3ECCD
MEKIQEGKTFKSPDINIDLNTYKKAIEHYYKNFNDALELNNNIPIFLDTNILLRFYSISFKQRELLKAFFTLNSQRIFLSGQVQKEFVKNREDVIQKYFHSALESMSKNLKSDIVDKLTKYKNDHKEVLKDFDYIDKTLQKQIKSFERVGNDLKKDIDQLRIKNKQLNFSDSFLDLINSFNQNFGLDENEIDLLKKEFDILTKGIDAQKLKNDIEKKLNFSFPGLGDMIEKPENPYGDYFIYHEMIKCALENKSDIIFLTYDTTKGDWMKSNKEPHIHYVLRTFELCNQSIFILDAERFFEKHLKTNFESLIDVAKNSHSIDNLIEQDILLDCVTLERIIRTISEFVCIEKSEIKPTGILLRNLVEMNIVEKNRYEQIREIMRVRSQISHRSKDYIKERYSKDFLLKIFDELEDCIDYLNKKYSEL